MNEKMDSQGKRKASGKGGRLPLEDLALKAVAQYFGDELLPYLGITEKLSAVMPTEQVELLVRHLFEDFNFEMEKGKAWLHMEFESDSIRTEDLRRFREYEATTSNVYHVSVTTCVICSSDVKEIMTDLTEGINTYRIKIIRLKGSNADELFSKLLSKQKNQEPLGKSDLVPVLLSPLMSGKTAQKDRVIQGLRLLQSEEVQVSEEERKTMQAVLYTLANKFLSDTDLKQVKELISMTRLGQMLVEDGIAEGIAKGIAKGIAAMITENLEENVAEDRIIEKLIKHFSLEEQAAKEYLESYEEKAGLN